MSTPVTSISDARPASPSLVSLLGAGRAHIVEHLRRHGDASVAELADELAISEVATRRHLGVLTDDGLVAARTVPQGRGRPPARYHLTETAAALFPHRYDRFASEVLDFLADTQGRDGLREFLRWRLERQVAGLREAVTAEDLQERLEQLATALSAAGFEASVRQDERGFTLTQEHCAIYDVAKEHPEVCAYEAATFSKVLGRDVALSRRETLATGASACVCRIGPVEAHDDAGTTAAARTGDHQDPASGPDPAPGPEPDQTNASPSEDEAPTATNRSDAPPETSTSQQRPGDDQ